MRKVKYIKLVKSTTEKDVVDAMADLNTKWQTMNVTEFGRELFMNRQCLNMQVKDFQVDTEQMSYQLGKFEGYLEAMLLLQEYEFRVESIQTFVKSKQMMYRILAYLYAIRTETRFITLPELQVAIYNPMSDNDFKELMYTLVNYGFVTTLKGCSSYSITPQGIHYYLTHKGDMEI